MTVELIQHWGSDQMVADAARVSTDRDREGRPIEGLIHYLAREKHMSPFEICGATFMVTAPLFVRDQWVRHRTQSYNALSLRYTALAADTNLKEVFYIPPVDRPLHNEGSKAHPLFNTPPSRDRYSDTYNRMYEAYERAYRTYLDLLESGVAEEVARMVLPTGTMTRFYATANLRNWAAFVKERTAENAQWEIKQEARAVSAILEGLFPVSWLALVSSPAEPSGFPNGLTLYKK